MYVLVFDRESDEPEVFENKDDLLYRIGELVSDGYASAFFEGRVKLIQGSFVPLEVKTKIKIGYHV